MFGCSVRTVGCFITTGRPFGKPRRRQRAGGLRRFRILHSPKRPSCRAWQSFAAALPRIQIAASDLNRVQCERVADSNLTSHHDRDWQGVEVSPTHRKMRRFRARPFVRLIDCYSYHPLALCNIRTRASLVVRFRSSTGANGMQKSNSKGRLVLLLIWLAYRVLPVFECFSLALHPHCTHRELGRFFFTRHKTTQPGKAAGSASDLQIRPWRRITSSFRSILTLAMTSADTAGGRNPGGLAPSKKTEVQWGFFSFLGGENPPEKQKSSGGNPHYRLDGKTPPLSIFRDIGPHARHRQRTGTLSNGGAPRDGRASYSSALSSTAAKLELVVPNASPAVPASRPIPRATDAR